MFTDFTENGTYFYIVNWWILRIDSNEVLNLWAISPNTHYKNSISFTNLNFIFKIRHASDQRSDLTCEYDLYVLIRCLSIMNYISILILQGITTWTFVGKG